MGVIQSCGGFVCYFVVFNEFGFSPGILYRLIVKPYFHHNDGDIYNPLHPTLGNTNLICENGNLTLKDSMGKSANSDGKLQGYVVDWLFTQDTEQDLRMGYISDFTCSGNVVTSVKPRFVWGECMVH